MSWWARWTTELRSFLGVPWVDPNTPAALGVWGLPTASGEPVSVARAVGLSAVWSCVNLISGAIASMPCILYRRDADGDREKAVEHPLFDVLRLRPNPVQSRVAFWEAMVVALLLRGNAHALITRDDDGRVRALWFVNPDRVTVELTKSGKLKYTVATPTGKSTVPDGQMLHVCGPMSDDGYTGRSVIATCRDTLGLGLALESYGSEFFANASTPRGVLTAPNMLSAPAVEKLKDSIEAAARGKGRRHGTLVLEAGLKWEAIGMSHDDAQFLQSRRFSTEEISRLFGVPGYLIGAESQGGLTYSTAETRALDFLKFCLGPWIARIESALNFSCISPLERRTLYVEFLPDALLATDIKGRYDAYQIGLSAGFLTLDEVRRKENLPPLPERVPSLT